MSLVMLKSTSNPNFSYIVGRTGDLSVSEDGRFNFTFIDRNGEPRLLSSGIKGKLGELDDVRSKTVCFKTNNSLYEFEKLENYIEESKIFSCSSLDEKITSAESKRTNDFVSNNPFNRNELEL